MEHPLWEQGHCPRHFRCAVWPNTPDSSEGFSDPDVKMTSPGRCRKWLRSISQGILTWWPKPSPLNFKSFSFILKPFLMLYVIKKRLSHISYTLIEEVGKYLDILESKLFLMALPTWVLFQCWVHEGSELLHLYFVCDYSLLQSRSWYSLSWTTSIAVWFLKHQNDFMMNLFSLWNMNMLLLRKANWKVLHPWSGRGRL